MKRKGGLIRAPGEVARCRLAGTAVVHGLNAGPDGAEPGGEVVDVSRVKTRRVDVGKLCQELRVLVAIGQRISKREIVVLRWIEVLRLGARRRGAEKQTDGRSD